MKLDFNFMCCKHRQICIKNPRIAQVLWAKCLLNGRRKVKARNFQQGILSYGNAMEIASILLVNDTDVSRAEIRYSRTLTEFAYIYRAAKRPDDVRRLLDITEEKFKQCLHRKPIQVLLDALVKALTCSQQQVLYWLDEIHVESDIQIKPIHIDENKAQYIH